MLGKGQYGEVYLGKELLTARQTACKIVNVDAAVQELTKYHASEELSQTWEDSYLRLLDGKKKIMREIRILSKLDHVSTRLHTLLHAS
jgi:serine/threonine protein kinase